MAALGKVIVAAAAIWPVVLVGRVVDRIGKGVRGAPRDALLAEDVAPTNLGRVYGFHRAADTMGAVVGPLIGLIAGRDQGDIRARSVVGRAPRDHLRAAGRPDPGEAAPRRRTHAGRPGRHGTAGRDARPRPRSRNAVAADFAARSRSSPS